MIEVMGAIFIITVGIVGVANMLPSFISMATANSSQLVASYLAQEGVEIIRNIRDGNWLEQDAWDEGLTGCPSPAGCEVDHTVLGMENPTLSTYQDRYLYVDGTNNLYRYIGSPGPSDSRTKFKRRITIASGGGGTFLDVSVDVFWQEKGRTYHALARESLYNWK